MTRAEALAVAAEIIAKHTPDLAAAIEFLEIAGVTALAKALRKVAAERPIEIAGEARPDPTMWRRGRL